MHFLKKSPFCHHIHPLCSTLKTAAGETGTKVTRQLYLFPYNFIIISAAVTLVCPQTKEHTHIQYSLILMHHGEWCAAAMQAYTKAYFQHCLQGWFGACIITASRCCCFFLLLCLFTVIAFCRPQGDTFTRHSCSHTFKKTFAKCNLFMKLTECILSKKCFQFETWEVKIVQLTRKNLKYFMTLSLQVFLSSHDFSGDSPQLSERFLEDSTNLNSRLTCPKAKTLELFHKML